MTPCARVLDPRSPACGACSPTPRPSGMRGCCLPTWQPPWAWQARRAQGEGPPPQRSSPAQRMAPCASGASLRVPPPAAQASRSPCLHQGQRGRPRTTRVWRAHCGGFCALGGPECCCQRRMCQGAQQPLPGPSAHQRHRCRCQGRGLAGGSGSLQCSSGACASAGTGHIWP